MFDIGIPELIGIGVKHLKEERGCLGGLRPPNTPTFPMNCVTPKFFLFIVMLVFGVGRISKIAGEIGSGIRAFREGLQGPGESQDQNPEADTDQQGVCRGSS